MTLAAACLALPALGIVDLQIHRDHLCHEERSHPHSACPFVELLTFSAADLMPVADMRDLRRLLNEKLSREMPL
jgi:hypothetical protein